MLCIVICRGHRGQQPRNVFQAAIDFAAKTLQSPVHGGRISASPQLFQLGRAATNGVGRQRGRDALGRMGLAPGPACRRHRQPARPPPTGRPRGKKTSARACGKTRCRPGNAPARPPSARPEAPRFQPSHPQPPAPLAFPSNRARHPCVRSKGQNRWARQPPRELPTRPHFVESVPANCRKPVSSKGSARMRNSLWKSSWTEGLCSRMDADKWFMLGIFTAIRGTIP